MVNSSGGLLSKGTYILISTYTITYIIINEIFSYFQKIGHPLGATGLAQCAELCWQIRGEAGKRQARIRN